MSPLYRVDVLLRCVRILMMLLVTLTAVLSSPLPVSARVAYSVAYTSNRSGTNQVYLFTGRDTSNAPLYVALTSSSNPSSAPTLFPEFHNLNGCKVAFQRTASGDNNIYVSDIVLQMGAWHATNETLLVGGTTDDTQPAWSPLQDTALNQYTNRNKIAFTRAENGHTRLYWIGAPLGPTTSGPAPGTSGSPSSPVALTPAGSYDDFAPAWSPTGDKIVFVSNRDGHNQLYLLDVSSGSAGTITRLTNTTSTNDTAPTWMAGHTGGPSDQIIFQRDGVLYSINTSSSPYGSPTSALTSGGSAITGTEPALGPLSDEVLYTSSANNIVFHDLFSTNVDSLFTNDGSVSILNTQTTIAADWADMDGGAG